MMTKKELQQLIDTCSADLSRWPQDKIKPALALIGQDAAARRIFDDALQLDDILRRDGVAMPDTAALSARIMAAIEGVPQEVAPEQAPEQAPAGLWIRPAYLFAPSGGLLAMAVAGFMLGFMPQQQGAALLHPMYYTADQIVSADADIYERGVY